VNTATNNMTHNVKVFAIGRVFIDRPARTNASLKYFVEVKICCLIIKVKPELQPSKD
jgi:hypothetical protein